LLTQQKQQAATSPRDKDTDRGGDESDHERPIKATIEEIARALALYIQENTRSLINDLLGRGEIHIQQPFANPDRPTTLAFGIECLLFSAFLLGMVIRAEFGSHGDRIRNTLAGSLFELAQNMGLSRQYADDFDRLRDTTFEEYGDVLKRGDGSQASFEELARLAWSRISGGEPQRATSHFILFANLMATLGSFKGFGARHTVVG